MPRSLFLLLLMPALLAGPALAAVPSTMSYQGVLMDDTGALLPDGKYSMTFRIYDVPTEGTALWSETQTVGVSRGGFSVVLGSVTPLTGLAFEAPYWLGIRVGIGVELSPRVELAASPYGLSLRLPFGGADSTAGAVLAIANAGSGPAITADPLLAVGTPTRDGTLRVYANGVVGAEVGEYDDSGGYLHLFDAGGATGLWLGPDTDGGASWFYVRGGTGSFTVDGNNGSGSPTVYIGGAASHSHFHTNLTGNAAVMLPSGSVSADEILDEPGIAQGRVAGTVNVPIGPVGTTPMGDIVTVTLTTPADGYIVVEADGTHNLGGSTTATTNYADLQIDETAGGDADDHYLYVSGYYLDAAGTHEGYEYAPLSVRRTYYKDAGTYTFRLEARGAQNQSLVNSIWNPTITATFYPTGYGTVTTAVSIKEAGRFTDVRRAVSPGQLPQPPTSEGALVDLRELELRATRARLAAEQAERQLIEARLAEQMAEVAKPAATKP